MPGVCAVLGSSDVPGITQTPSCFHLGSLMGATLHRLERYCITPSTDSFSKRGLLARCQLIGMPRGEGNPPGRGGVEIVGFPEVPTFGVPGIADPFVVPAPVSANANVAQRCCAPSF